MLSSLNTHSCVASLRLIHPRMEAQTEKKKMKILCLHGFRTSGSFLRKQISKWDPSIFSQFHLDFPDGIFPAGGKSEIEGIFPPPYFEWFQFDKDFTEYTNLEECISYLCEYITSKGPFDGLLGFSQGATLSALLLGYQAQGKVLKEHPGMKLFVSISGSKFRDPKICEVAYRDKINVKSVHFIGAKDWLKLPSQELASAFENPLIINHPQAHTVPRLDEKATEQMKSWTMEILQCSNSITDITKHRVENGETKKEDDDQEEPRTEEVSYKINKHGVENGETKKEDDDQEEPRKEEACHKINKHGVENGETKKEDDDQEEPRTEEACYKTNAQKIFAAAEPILET